MNTRRIAIVTAIAVGAYAQVACTKLASPPDVTVLMRPCIEEGVELSKLMALAESGAAGPDYAAEAKKIASACRDTRVALETHKLAPDCARMAAATERMAWATSAKFETGQYPSGADPLVGFDLDMATACSAIMDPPAK